MTRMVLSSFYNTLINEEEAIPTSTMFEIDRIRQNKVLFVVITNRISKEVLYYNKDFPFIDYLISLNGSCIYDSKNKCIYKSYIEDDIIQEVEKKFTNIIYYTDNNSYTNRNNIDNICKLEIPISKKEEIKKLNKINAKVSLFKLNNKMYIEIISNKSNIINAIEIIKEKEKISNDEIISIIGNQSEKEIINIVDKTYVVSNSKKEFGKIKINLTNSNNEKGVENILSKIFNL